MVMNERNKAIEQVLEDERMACDDLPSAEILSVFTAGVERGFDAGYQARQASEWVAIHSVHDLPKDENRYIWRRCNGDIDIAFFRPLHAEFLQECVDGNEAWMPIPEYKSSGEGV